MSDGFNPYREWLSLSTSSPNYYELLGLPLQESDPAKIAAAADRAITRVRSFRPGPQGREWARLLDEIRAAKECLLDPDCRAQYDAEQAEAATADPILPPGAASEAESSVTEYTHSVNASNSVLPSPPDIPAIPARLDTSQLPEAVLVASAAPTTTPTWSAGPSPMYGFAGNENTAGRSLPATIVVQNSPAMPEPMAILKQPMLSVTHGTAQRATFRAAATQSQKAARPRGRGIMWGIILLLWLTVAGLTYRLSIVARQQQAAEDAATEAEANRVETEPHANSSPQEPAKAAANDPKSHVVK